MSSARRVRHAEAIGIRWISAKPASAINDSILPGSDNSNIAGADQVHVHVPECRNGLQDYFEKLATAFRPIPDGDGIAPARLQNAISFAYSLRRIGQMQ